MKHYYSIKKTSLPREEKKKATKLVINFLQEVETCFQILSNQIPQLFEHLDCENLFLSVRDRYRTIETLLLSEKVSKSTTKISEIVSCSYTIIICDNRVNSVIRIRASLVDILT